MTTEEDQIFLNILDTVSKMNLSHEEEGAELMERFVNVYLEMPSTQHNPKIMEMIRKVHPELFV